MIRNICAQGKNVTPSIQPMFFKQYNIESDEGISQIYHKIGTVNKINGKWMYQIIDTIDRISQVYPPKEQKKQF